LPPVCSSTLPFTLVESSIQLHTFTLGLSSVVTKVPVQVILPFSRDYVISVQCEVDTHVDFSVGNIATVK
jgi:hypothetical protein